MRRVGRISNWNDGKGYGFVVPHDGGERSFVHVRAFQPGSRRPVDGDLISYRTVEDARGRNNALDVRFAGQRIVDARPARPIPRMAIGAAFLSLVAVGALFGAVPVAIAIGYGVLSAVSYVMYPLDKAAAGKGRRRTPESSLLVVDLLGGWPGGLMAQQRFHHKTAKASFQSAFWTMVFVNLAAVAALVWSGAASSLDALSSG